MKHSKLSCFYCFYCCCYYHCYVTILIFIALNIAQVSPEITTNFSTNEQQTFIEDSRSQANDTKSMASNITISLSNTTLSPKTNTIFWHSSVFHQYTLSTLPSVEGKGNGNGNSNTGKIRRARELDETERMEKCRLFVDGDPTKNELYSPDYPNDYPRNISCTRVITAPKGQIIRMDFRNSFHIEAKDECKFDFLEIRDGQYGYSELIGKFCGTDFPPEITSRERYLWLHFQSDESIEYSGFTAVFEFLERSRDSPSTDINCTIEKDGYEGFINSTDVPPEIKEIVETGNIPLDCLWHIQVPDNWKIQVKFLDFKLSKPNDCDSNFLDIFPEETIMPARIKNFCGSAGEGVTSESNILHIHFYAEQDAIASSFGILFTAFRDKGAGCTEEEYDCEDATCISKELECNDRDNCKFRWDEEECKKESEGQSEHVVIIIVVFGLILGGMVITFLVNCMRKLIHDQKIIREHIRQSKESKLDEMSHHSKARSKEHIELDVPLRQKQSQGSLEILSDLPEHYYPEVVPLPPSQASKNSKDKEHSILRHQHDMTVQTSICDDSSTTTTADGDNRDFAKGASNACDMGCQTRESLFITTPIMSKQPTGSIGAEANIRGIPPPRFSTFATATTESSIKTIPETPEAVYAPRYHSHLHEHSTAMPLTDLPPRVYHEPMCHLHHHQHQQQQQPSQVRSIHTQQQQPYDERQSHHHHYHAQRQQPPPPPQMKSEITLPISTPHSAPILEPIQLNQPPVASASSKTKLKQRNDQSKEYMDVRNSAPDVIIMTSH